MPILKFFDISLERANQFYSWGWRLSVFGAVITLLGVALLWWGTRVRDRDTEQKLSQLSEATAQRDLTPAQRDKLVAALSGRPLTVQLTWFTGDPEASAYAAAIGNALRMANVTVKEIQVLGAGRIPIGLVLQGTEGPDSNLLAGALKAAEIPFDVGGRQPQLEIWVGTRPRQK